MVKGDFLIFSPKRSFLLRKRMMEVSMKNLLLQMESKSMRDSCMRFCSPGGERREQGRQRQRDMETGKEKRRVRCERGTGYSVPWASGSSDRLTDRTYNEEQVAVHFIPTCRPLSIRASIILDQWETGLGTNYDSLGEAEDRGTPGPFHCGVYMCVCVCLVLDWNCGADLSSWAQPGTRGVFWEWEGLQALG
jgi:hypothetical protein